MSESSRVVYGLVRAGATFVSTLVTRTLKPSDLPDLPPVPHLPLYSGPAAKGVDNRCPVCQARFRGARVCSRCGADLEPLMQLTVRAWQLREAARQSLDNGDAECALRLAGEAQEIQSTESGDALRLLSQWLGR